MNIQLATAVKNLYGKCENLEKIAFQYTKINEIQDELKDLRKKYGLD